MKVNNNMLTDNAIQNPNNSELNLRWFDLYVNLFDKANYDLNSNNEFKWPGYSQKIVSEINQGILSADFNKLYSYTCNATFGKYSGELGGFPITQIWSNIVFVSYELPMQNELTLGLGTRFNDSDFDFILKMDPIKAEKLVERNSNRTINVKVIYNVVNRNMTDLNKWKAKYLGIYTHKIVFMEGSTV
ncbi:MAG: DUF4852 domain-containing protein, partial [Actinobacteria bacterium]|nr:DUF4852 domain-containing protein [Actinomycetota bacterium]